MRRACSATCMYFSVLGPDERTNQRPPVAQKLADHTTCKPSTAAHTPDIKEAGIGRARPEVLHPRQLRSGAIAEQRQHESFQRQLRIEIAKGMHGA